MSGRHNLRPLVPNSMSRDEDIFAEVLELPAADRGEFLRRIAQEDQTRSARLEALLRGHERALNFSNFLRAPLAAVGSTLTAAAPPSRIGRYQLLEKIGEGGCGVVYLAEQQEPVRRRVALKLIKLGMDTDAVVARFEAERQALAVMDHPNIAKVFDAGASESGRPYFVMELVRGVAITKYCDQNRLGLRERIALFIPVCAALHHAHQKGIVHRDLKPSNILVAETDGAPVPKVIDFGVAKATQGRLTEHTLYTTVEQFIGTPVYMSPEQADSSGLDLDARSDIYTLGVVLFELLAGQTPFDAQSLATTSVEAVRRQIREIDPPKPSTRLRTLSEGVRATLAKSRAVASAELPLLLRGDLDCIVMRCLEKDRTRRYATAQELAADLQRYLAHQPVLARPRSSAYVLRKFVRRHRSALGPAALLLAALGAGVWTWLRDEPRPPIATAVSVPSSPAIQARELTQRAFALCRKLGFLRGDLAVAEDLARQATELDPTSARAWGVRAWVEAAFCNRNWDRGSQRLQAAQSLAEHALSLDPNEPEALNAEAQVLIVQGDNAAAEGVARRAATAAPDDYISPILISAALHQLGRYDEQLKVLQDSERRDPDNVLIHYALATYYETSPPVATKMGFDSRPNIETAIEQRRIIVRLHPFASNWVMLAEDGLTIGDLGQMQAALDQLGKMPLEDQSEDRAVYWAALGALCERKPELALAAAQLTARTYFDDALIASPKAWLTAWAQREAGHPDQARAEWETAASVLRRRLRDDPDNQERYTFQLATTLAWLGRTEEAAQWIEKIQGAAKEDLTPSRAAYFAEYYAALGDARETAFYVRKGALCAGCMRFSPEWDKVRDTPEIQTELRRIGGFDGWAASK